MALFKRYGVRLSKGEKTQWLKIKLDSTGWETNELVSVDDPFKASLYTTMFSAEMLLQRYKSGDFGVTPPEGVTINISIFNLDVIDKD